MERRILIAGGGTGGHLYPALSLAEALRRADPDVRVLMIGARRGVEARVLPGEGFEYRLLPLEPLHRRRPWRNWRLAVALPVAGAAIASLMRRYRPQLVVGTGGYVSGPVVLAGVVAGARTAIQEQNAFPGFATRRLAPLVDQVHLGVPEARSRLRPGRRTAVFEYGNPVALREPAVRFPWPAPPVIGVFGGSQGARGLNEQLLADLRETQSWEGDASLVWVTGPSHHARISAEAATLPFAERLRVVPYIEGLGAQLRHVTLAVTRAGAMTCAELAAAGVPAVFVPFPAAAANHQRHNAVALARAGAAVVLEEGAMRRGELWSTVLQLLRDDPRRERMAEAMRERGHPEAADRIAAELLALLRDGNGDARAGGERAGA